jgi:hypothetical protein
MGHPAVSHRALDFTFSGTLPQWLFQQDFQPVDGAQEEAALSRI